MRVFRPLSRGAAAAAAAVAVLGVGGGVFAATQWTSTGRGSQQTVADRPAGPAEVEVVGLNKHGRVPWHRHLTLAAHNGALKSVLVSAADGTVLGGTLSPDRTRWRSDSRLVPLNRYQARVVLSTGGDTTTKLVRVKSTDSHRHLTALLSPGDNDVVGVGSPVIVRFSRPVPDSQRALVQDRLAVSTTPSVVGAWHWMSSQEVHWRPPRYWKPQTQVTVSSNLGGLYLGRGVWGEGEHQTSFKIGPSHISRVDAARHQMYVYENGKLIRTFPISAGSDKYPTKSGVHITFEKSQVVTMDSATVGIPRNSPDGYYEKVYWDVRISYGGAFVHAAPWSVADQGVVNVSHGCVNVAPANAEWFYNWSQRGDIVDVYNTAAPPDTADPGMADWNMSWKQWVAGDADPTATALAAHPKLPRAYEPAAPAYHPVTYTAPAAPAAPASPKPSPSPSTSPDHRTRHHNQH
ncbi:MAG TPA: Ig-like domain-containing protein [Mycobacteriales bacterium]|nr:Ig-like domain-containing protein [Mycobacteriales bacterium]